MNARLSKALDFILAAAWWALLSFVALVVFTVFCRFILAPIMDLAWKLSGLLLKVLP